MTRFSSITAMIYTQIPLPVCDILIKLSYCSNGDSWSVGCENCQFERETEASSTHSYKTKALLEETGLESCGVTRRPSQ